MEPWQGRVEVVQADAREFVRSLAPGSIDLVLSDAPYGLGLTKNRRNAPTNWDADGVAFDEAFWKAVKNTLKAGGLLLALGHPRTAHGQTSAIESAGFDIQDSIVFAKSHGFAAHARGLDGALRKIGATPGLADSYAGWGTHLAPRHELIAVCQNLGSGESLAGAIAKGGSGGMNLDAVRVAGPPEDRARVPGKVSDSASWAIQRPATANTPNPAGRYPGNLILEHGQLCDAEQCEESCVVRRMNEDDGRGKYRAGRPDDQPSRFFTALKYAPRAATTPHPTAKSTQLAEWLCALTVRPGAVVLDLFSGSGALGLAAARAGAGRVICVEREAQYVDLIENRLLTGS